MITTMFHDHISDPIIRRFFSKPCATLFTFEQFSLIHSALRVKHCDTALSLSYHHMKRLTDVVMRTGASCHGGQCVSLTVQETMTDS